MVDMVLREHYTVYAVYNNGQKFRRYFDSHSEMYEFVKEWENYLKEYRVYDTSYIFSPEEGFIKDFEPFLVWKK